MTEMPSSTSHRAGTHETPPGVTEELRVLRRSTSNRVVAGVLGGLGHRLGIDPLVLRVVTAVLALFGGVGVLLYALAWLLMPAEGEPASVLDQAIGRREVRDAAAVPLALGLGAVVVISTGVIVGSALPAWVLLILAGVGLLKLLRRQSDPGTSGSTSPTGPDDESPPGTYVPWSAMPSSSETGSGSSTTTSTTAGASGADTGVAWGDTPDTPDDADQQARTAEPTDDAPPYTTHDAAPATAPSGRTAGWPEGPDWGAPGPERSPYDDLYLQREAGPEPAPPAKEPRPRSVLGGITFCAALVAVGIVALADALGAGESGPLYIAVPLAVVAAGLLVGTWFGRSRWLIVLGILLSLALVPATAITHWDVATGDVVVSPPTTVAELPTEPIAHGAGSIRYDLSQLQLADDDDVSVTLQLGLGELRVVVPPEADVVVNADLGMGDMRIFDESMSGIGRNDGFTDLGPDGTGGGRLEINLDVGMGDVAITRADVASPDVSSLPEQTEQPERAPEVTR